MKLPPSIPWLTRGVLVLGGVVFRRFQQPRGRPDAPDWEGCRPVEGTSRDGVRIRGWWQSQAAKPGTVIFVHGITIHSFCYVEQARLVARETGLAVAAFDLRFHGLSEDAPFTFGTAESWDLRAFLDALEADGARRPFLVIGDSLGGLAAQRAAAEDTRIDGAIFLQSPASPWRAISGASGRFAPLSRFLNSCYGCDILADGDVRSLDPAKVHRPPVFYVMGERDHFGWESTRQIYDWWGTENAGEIGETPLTAPDRSRWFALVPDAVHDTGRPDCYNVWRWPLVWPNIVQFITLVAERAK